MWDSDGPNDQSANGALCSEASDYLSFLSMFPDSTDQLNCVTIGSLSSQHVLSLESIVLVVPVTDQFQPYPSMDSILLHQIDLDLNCSFSIYRKLLWTVYLLGFSKP